MASDDRQLSESRGEFQRQAHHSTRFRFKDTTKKEARSPELSSDIPDSNNPEKHKLSPLFYDRRKNKNKNKRRFSQKPELNDNPKTTDDSRVQDTSTEDLDPEVTFRESLFDAMRDDEGAQFWEGVYGQPIHIYPNTKPGPDGELERMTDDEYAAYVRRKMYEKTNEYLWEEKSRRDTARRERERLSKEAAEELRQAEKHRRKLKTKAKMDQKISNQKFWEEKWYSYLTRWDSLGLERSEETFAASIPWPVASGSLNDISSEEIERFLNHAPAFVYQNEGKLSKVVKAERIRWHPDKMQQKLGGQAVNQRILQTVTSVFQIIDEIWCQIRVEDS